MNLKKLLIYTSLVTLLFASCKKSDNSSTTPVDPTNPSNPTTPVVPVVPKAFAITENFEIGSKTAYAIANVTLSTGSWSFDDALIGNLAADVKNGNDCVRLRTGKISMNFDISGVTVISIKHAKYGTDATSTWQLFVSTDGGTTYTQSGSDITETNTTLATDSFKVTSATGKIRIQIRKAGTTRIDLDDITFKGTGDPGITIGIPDTGGSDTTATTKPAAERGILLDTDVPPTSGDNSNLLFGNPSAAQTTLVMPDNYLIDQGYYVESYSSSRETPNWVSWHLDATNTTNATARLDNFAGFTGLPMGFYHVESNAYSGSGFDRGHNCPSADRTSSIDANSATFLMTNMIPQAPQNNQQTWANLENYLREQVVSGNEVYIIMGSYGKGGVGSVSAATVSTLANSNVTVPSNVWKVAVIMPVGNADINRVTATTRVIAVNTPNVNSINSDWTKYIVTVRDIETATGYNLLSNLPQAVQDAIETKKDSGI